MNTQATAPDMTIRALVDFYAAQQAEQVFFISAASGKKVTWRALAAQLPAMEQLLQSLQIPTEQPLAFMLNNGWASVQIILGALYYGRIVVPLNIAAGDAQLLYALQQSGSAAVIVDQDNAARLQTIIGDNANIKIVQVDGDHGIENNDVENNPPLNTTRAITADTKALMIYTSGTTGTPKGVVHTQGSLLAGGNNVVLAHQLTAADRALCVLPLYHINGLCVTVFAPLLSGGSVVMPLRFRTEEFWQQVATHQCTWFSVVPTLISYLLQSTSPFPSMPQLRFGRSASAPLSPSVQEEFEQRFAIPIIETMGLTETAAQILSNPLPPATRKIGSPGIAYGNEVVVLGKDGTPCADNESGELAVCGLNVMLEYNNNPQETAATFTADGWLLTGDLGHRDSDGYFFITGRSKELIIKGGENIAPREIDEALMQMPQVVDAAAFARPCKRYGQRVEACVTLATGVQVEEHVLIEYCQTIVGRFKSPERIYFVADLPRGPSGKVQRIKLAELVSTCQSSGGGD